MLFLISTCLYSTIINIPADQPTIQVGINVAVNGDTLLVQPGMYLENINYNSKNITIASLFLITQDTTYISQTIIDGNQNGTVVSFENGETTGALLSGFTITNGSGGGIGCAYTSYPRLENLVITGNYAEYNGGGILCGANASPSLENVIISNNSAGGSGGGIYCYNYCSPSLENVTISNNTSHNGGGIFCLENCSANLDNVIITNNSANSDGGGILCAANSNLNLQDVALTGNTAADEGGGIYINDASPSLENVTISGNTANNGGGIYCEESNPDLESVSIINNSASSGGGINCTDNSSPSLMNVTISGNSGRGISCSHYSSPSLENVTISGNSGGIYCYNYSNPSLINVTITGNIAAGSGGGIRCYDSNPILSNVTITDNSADDGGGIWCYNANPSLVNVTISGNSADDEGSGIYCRENSNPDLIDCIFWNNSPVNIFFDTDADPNTITITYSDIQGGEAGIVTNNNGTVNWLVGNINENPLFVGAGDHPFMLQDLSPCVNAGIPDTTDLNLPEFDLAGNPRVYGGRIDMGAYENQNVVVNTDENLIPLITKLNHNYPNPFNPETKINYSLKEKSNVSLNIYNIKGQKVKQLVSTSAGQLSAGQHSVVWNGKDDNNKSVSSGIYFYKLKTGYFEKTKKMILIK